MTLMTLMTLIDLMMFRLFICVRGFASCRISDRIVLDVMVTSL